MCVEYTMGRVEGVVSIERWSCSGGASCVVEYTMGRFEGVVSVERWSCSRGASCVWWSTLWGGLREWSL